MDILDFSSCLKLLSMEGESNLPKNGSSVEEPP